MPWPVFDKPTPAQFVDPIDKERLIAWVQSRAEIWYLHGGSFVNAAEHAAHMKARQEYMEGISVREIMVQVLESFPAEEFGLA